ncbi:hypothetical protein AWM75_04465 [Aerococcus urinaehominis]|uniref:Purine nucleoside phosphorylase n=1 Tax=Aerococcus urinaehominis TaxID=128944 RepID=A0A0X8FL44_9LACT|nr:peptidoglycan editing factor PgeF [Aerococcus urinaehominis]AMB99300.1 hypothetical protein AWM75_04465 [Aerococcus urinaehominis]SDM19472.1 conserved hypothetical protein [Aerococcus urinaehominis]
MSWINYHSSPKNILMGSTSKNNQLDLGGNTALHTGQDSDLVIKNRQILADDMGYSLDRFVFSQQTHSANSQLIKNKQAGRGAFSNDLAIANTDALYSFEKNLVLTCFTADCVPVTFYEEEAGLIGLIHSGWRGTLQNISGLTMAKIAHDHQVDLGKVKAHIGQALCQDCFEVDRDVGLAFQELDHQVQWINYRANQNKYYIDNQAFVVSQLEEAGLNPENISIDRHCTLENDQAFSYRENRTPGRQLHFIVRKA